MTVEDTCRVGDPDPTPNEPPWCQTELDDPANPGDPFVCTRRPGHPGQHVCGDGAAYLEGPVVGVTVVAVWEPAS